MLFLTIGHLKRATFDEMMLGITYLSEARRLLWPIDFQDSVKERQGQVQRVPQVSQANLPHCELVSAEQRLRWGPDFCQHGARQLIQLVITM